MFDRRQIPNLLTCARIVAGIAVFALMAGLAGGGPRGLADWAFVLFALGSVTDFFDGWLARRWGGHLRLGNGARSHRRQDRGDGGGAGPWCWRGPGRRWRSRAS